MSGGILRGYQAGKKSALAPILPGHSRSDGFEAPSEMRGMTSTLQGVAKSVTMLYMIRDTRPIRWIKAARKDFEDFPQETREHLLDALTFAAAGKFPTLAKPLKGFGSGIYELALRFRSDAYRVVYAVPLGGAVWVIHAFQKKSKARIKTPQAEIELIRKRLVRLKEELR